MLLQLSQFFSPLYCPSGLYLPPSSILALPLSSCPWVVHRSSLASLFPILFLTSPYLFCTYQLCFLFPIPFSPFPPSPFSLTTLHVISISLILFLFQLFAQFLFFFLSLFRFMLIVVSLLSFSCSYFLSSFSQISPFNISCNKGLVMMNSLNLTFLIWEALYPPFHFK